MVRARAQKSNPKEAVRVRRVQVTRNGNAVDCVQSLKFLLERFGCGVRLNAASSLSTEARLVHSVVECSRIVSAFAASRSSGSRT